MKEIKFRAWANDTMFYLDAGYHIIFWDDPRKVNYGLYTNADDSLVSKEDRGLILMQFTGLKDKNGKEIYEGDILTSPDGDFEVCFDEGCFWVSQELDFNAPLYVYATYENICEVIGNIYENPELIKES